MMIDQKEVCLRIRDSLISDVPVGTRIIANKEYTHVQVTSQREIIRPDIALYVEKILQKAGCIIYRPRWTELNRFVAIKNNRFADIEIRSEKLEDKNLFQYNIYIYISPTEIEFEWWYDKFMDSI